ncbi:ATP synthase F0 subunit A [bacterium CG2_30_54_10]|nr:MAG: ATP synthase F0 subunit A [bacterium CG2_30_54_10]
MHALESKIFYFFPFIPIPPGAFLPWLITLGVFIFCYLATRQILLQPTPLQNVAELIYLELEKFIIMIAGPKHSKRLMPYLGTMFLYVLLSNMMGLIPGFKSPTSVFSNCLGMAMITFFLTHLFGLWEGGFHYVAHFWGEPWWLGPLMFPLHIIGELSRPLSLTFRLFGNIMGEDVVILVLTVALFPFLIPLPMMFMALFTSFLQAMVFTILSGVYLSGALPAEGHDHENPIPIPPHTEEP